MNRHPVIASKAPVIASEARQSPHKGATLFEMMLVLSFGALFFTLSMSVYQSYQNILQARQVRANVDQLLDAMSTYYRANCANVSNPVTAAVTIATLKSQGFLSNWFPANPLVDVTYGDELGYIIQYNPVMVDIPVSVNTCVVLQSGVACTPATPASTIPTAQAKAIRWVMQVSVKIKGTATNKIATLGADDTSANLATWTRAPSYMTSKSILSTTMPLLNQFQLQYTHDANYELNSGYTTQMYYLCGG